MTLLICTHFRFVYVMRSAALFPPEITTNYQCDSAVNNVNIEVFSESLFLHFNWSISEIDR